MSEDEAGFTPGPSDRNRTIAHFLLMQYCRTRDFRDAIGSAMAELSSMITYKNNISIKYMAEKGEEIKSQPCPTLDGMVMSPLSHAKFMFGSTFVNEVFPTLLEHIWLIGDNVTSQPLFTSDAPVIKHPHLFHDVYGGNGFVLAGIEIQLPLSSRFCADTS